MSSYISDPDIKVNMSLDDIIRMSKGRKGSQQLGKNSKTTRRQKKIPRRVTEDSVEHSVPLLPSTGGLGVYVTKQSPLLSAENRRRIAQAVSNRVINSDLLQKSKEIIPAEYKLVKTDQGVERVLVPATDFFRPRKKLPKPRKLNRATSSVHSEFSNDSLPAKPPPLVSAPIFQPPLPATDMKMEVDEPEVVIVEPPKNKEFEVIDVESDIPAGLSKGREVSVPAPLSLPQSSGETLNDRFTRLIENFQR